VFDAFMPTANQIARQREDVQVSEEELLAPVSGTRTEAGLRHNIRVSIQYLEAWLRGQGCVPLYNLMEDAATAEICRVQLWQWLRHGAPVESADSTLSLTPERCAALLDAEMRALSAELGDAFRDKERRFSRARALFEKLVLGKQLEDFLTLPAYRELVAGEQLDRR
jgi:malate synthase